MVLNDRKVMGKRRREKKADGELVFAYPESKVVCGADSHAIDF